ncbi:protein disulfide-isomerase tmx3a-like [Pholidichthys leucotaenia]
MELRRTTVLVSGTPHFRFRTLIRAGVSNHVPWKSRPLQVSSSAGDFTKFPPTVKTPAEERTCRNCLSWSVLMVLVSAFVEELDNSFMETKTDEDIWLIEFYAPWCTFCKQLDPVWHQVGSELRSLGSPVRVGKSDATTNTGLAHEFHVRAYPAILMLKKGVKYNYSGPRTKDGIMDFTNRVSGPPVRSLSSLQLFQHTMSRHDVMFVYVGAMSQLKGNFTSAAEELIVHTWFFSASRDVLPKAVTVSSLPAVLVFKDGGLFSYSEEHDRDLKAWINRERFPTFSHIDSYTLYAMGNTGKLVMLALVDEKHLSGRSLRYKSLLEMVAAEHRDTYSRTFFFGFMEGTDYINGLIMSEVMVPSFIAVNLSNDGYFLPPSTMETEVQLLDFLDGVLNGSIEEEMASSSGSGVSFMKLNSPWCPSSARHHCSAASLLASPFLWPPPSVTYVVRPHPPWTTRMRTEMLCCCGATENRGTRRLTDLEDGNRSRT